MSVIVMNREYHRWYSSSLDRDMELLVFGHAGTRVLIFPTSQGRFFQWEDTGMVAELSEHLEKGWVQLFCVDSVDDESWYAKWKHPSERAKWHMRYDRYLLEEVLPFTRQHNTDPFLITVGTSFGAYHAVNFALRYPQLVGRTIGLSGLYDIKRFTEGYSDDNVYFNNPRDFIKNEHDPERLRALQHVDIILAIGKEDSSCADNEAFSSVLWEKNIGHALRLWDGWAHDWPWWKQMIRMYIGGHD
ncbi:MAG TPA: alpha/beta hydrolase-fold protein [Ktedonobacteraceae bacterium]|nr:alpha/beta hydrolase-fold protein [Ktedonobacteraceae bacterium]